MEHLPIFCSCLVVPKESIPSWKTAWASALLPAPMVNPEELLTSHQAVKNYWGGRGGGVSNSMCWNANMNPYFTTVFDDTTIITSHRGTDYFHNCMNAVFASSSNLRQYTLVAACFLKFWLDYSLTLKIIQSSSPSVNFKWNTRCHIPADNTFHSHYCDSLKSGALHS
jgi:hypothetical protein